MFFKCAEKNVTLITSQINKPTLPTKKMAKEVKYRQRHEEVVRRQISSPEELREEMSGDSILEILIRLHRRQTPPSARRTHLRAALYPPGRASSSPISLSLMTGFMRMIQRFTRSRKNMVICRIQSIRLMIRQLTLLELASAASFVMMGL